MDTTVCRTLLSVGHSRVQQNQKSCTFQCKVFQEPMSAVKREKEGKKEERERERGSESRREGGREGERYREGNRSVEREGISIFMLRGGATAYGSSFVCVCVLLRLLASSPGLPG